MSREERGSVTLFAVSCLTVLLLFGAGLGVVAAIVTAHRTAQSAADLAALAAAGAVGAGEPCAAGEAVAEANGARLDACSVRGRDVTVRVSVTGPRWLGQTGDLTAQARAGPR
ncbi:MAG: Rv3654c family TadE-like protein [Nocardioides sp.]